MPPEAPPYQLPLGSYVDLFLFELLRRGYAFCCHLPLDPDARVRPRKDYVRDQRPYQRQPGKYEQ